MACACDVDAGAADREALERLARLEEERAALVEELARVRSASVPAPTDGGVAAPAPNAAMEASYAQLRVTLAQQLRDQADCDDMLDLITHLRAAATGGTRPAICGNASLRDRVAQTASAGGAMHSRAADIKERIDALCERYDRWATPDERVQSAIASYGERVDRVEHWLADFGTCLGATGHRAFECDNTYGGVIDQSTIAEAAHAHDLVVALQRELAGARAFHTPFPCSTPSLTRIDAVTAWRGTMANAQMPDLPRGAAHVCQVIGVDERSVTEALRVVTRSLDSGELESHTRQRALTQVIANLRANLPDGG